MNALSLILIGTSPILIGGLAVVCSEIKYNRWRRRAMKYRRSLRYQLQREADRCFNRYGWHMAQTQCWAHAETFNCMDENGQFYDKSEVFNLN